MKLPNYLVLLAASSVVVAAGLVTATTYAHEGHSHTSMSDSEHAKMQQSTESDATTTQSDETRKQRIATKRAELQQKFEAERTEVKSKLKDDRLKLCKANESRINDFLGARHKRGGETLAHLQSIEKRVRDYYTSSGVTLTNYDALSQAIDDKEAAAVAAVMASGESTFSCDQDDATQPGRLPRAALSAQRDALKDYRGAIHNLIAAMQKAKGTDGAKETM